MTRPGEFLVAGLRETDLGETLPRVADVAGRAPTVAAGISAPFPDIAAAVLAQTVNDVAVHLLQRLMHLVVRRAQFGDRFAFADLAITAPVVLQVVEPPEGELERILVLVAVAAGVTLAGPRTGRDVNAGFESQAV